MMICPKAKECHNKKCSHAKVHVATNNCTNEPCHTFEIEAVFCVETAPVQLYICPHHEICEDAALGDCKHATPHDPIELDDNCIDEPCPYGDELKPSKKIYCLPYMKPFEIELEKELFEI